MSLEDPAHGLAKGPPSEVIPRRKSMPPRNANNPIMTTICMNSFCLFGIIIDKQPNTRIGIPIIDGIKEVMDSLALK